MYYYIWSDFIAIDDAITFPNGNDFYDNGHYFSQTKTPEYGYDKNGNMVSDLNKEILEIKYNELNLPVEIIKDQNNRIEYLYDALGNKKRQITYSFDGIKTIMKTTDFIGNVVYIDGVPAWNTFDEGRVVYSSTGVCLYENQIKDHLGSVRVAYEKDASGLLVRQVNSYYPYGMNITSLSGEPVNIRASGNEYLYNGKMFQDELGLDWLDYGARFYDPALGRWHSVDPLAEKYAPISPYAYVANNPLIFIDPDGRKIRLANNYAGGMENIARIAATNLGGQVLSHLIGRNETYTLNSTFWSSSSSYNPSNRHVNYVGNPWYSEIPYDGGALNSMVAMGHESFHAFDHSNNVFNENNAAYSKGTVEPRAVSFGNYLREAYSLSPLREKYGSIQGNFNQFAGSGEKISDFVTLGNNADKTSYGFSYTKTTTNVESYKTGFLGIKIPDKTRTETATYYMTVSRDSNNNASFQIYNNEEEYKKATSNW